MGKYINAISGNAAPSNGKVNFILNNVPGAVILEAAPTQWRDDLVCVVENGFFEAAAYAYNESEMNVFMKPDGRKKTWLLVPNAKEYAR